MIKRWNSSELHLVAETKKDKRTLNKICAKIDKILVKKSKYYNSGETIDYLMKNKKQNVPIKWWKIKS